MDPKFVIIGPLEIFFGGGRGYRTPLDNLLARQIRSPLLPPYYLAPQIGFEPTYYALRPLRLINSQVSYQLEYRGINFGHR